MPSSVRHCLSPVAMMAKPARSRALADGGELGDDGLAVLAFVEHADDGVSWPWARLSRLDTGHAVWVELHQTWVGCRAVEGGSEPLGGVVGHGLQRRVVGHPTIGRGRPPRPSGGRVDGADHHVARQQRPMDGSACSAAKASGGRQAPRITWGGTSASSLAFIVAGEVDLGEDAEALVGQCGADRRKHLGVGARDGGGEREELIGRSPRRRPMLGWTARDQGHWASGCSLVVTEGRWIGIPPGVSCVHLTYPLGYWPNATHASVRGTHV